MTAGLPTLRLHHTLVHAGVGGVGVLNDEGRHVVLYLDLYALILLQPFLVVEELKVVLVAAREADVEANAVPGVDLHLLQRSRGFGLRLHHILLAGLHHVKVAAALRGANNVLKEAGKHTAVVGTRLGNSQTAGVVGGVNLEVLGVVDGEAVAEPLDHGIGGPGEPHGEGGGLALRNCHRLQRLLEHGGRHVLLKKKIVLLLTKIITN